METFWREKKVKIKNQENLGWKNAYDKKKKVE